MGSQGDEGWPLGLPPVTFRMRLVDAFTEAAAAGGGDANSLVLTATPSFSSLSSSDLDTESTMSFFPEKSITLGALIGIAGAADYPSFRHSLSSVSTSKTASRRRGLSCSRLPRRSDSAAKLWSLIRCGTCRCAYYADDNSSIGAPPSLGHFLEAERQAERSDNDAKVYINIMYEESVGDYIAPEAINPLFDSVASPAANFLQGSCSSAAELPAIAEEDPETPAISSSSGRRREPSTLADSMAQSMRNDGRRLFKDEEEPGSRSMQFMHNDGLFRVHTAAAEESRSMQCMRNNGLSARVIAAAASRSRRKHRRSHSDGVCVLNCVSYIWSFPKGRNVKDNDTDTDTSYSRKCCPIEISDSNADLENGISYTNCSFHERNLASFQGGACICSTVESNSGLNEIDLDSIDVLEAEICDRQGVNHGHLDSNFGQKQAKYEQGQLKGVNSGQLESNYGQKEVKYGQVESISGGKEASNDGKVDSHCDRQELIDGESSSNCGQEEVINGELSSNCGQEEVINGELSSNSGQKEVISGYTCCN